MKLSCLFGHKWKYYLAKEVSMSVGKGEKLFYMPAIICRCERCGWHDSTIIQIEGYIESEGSEK